MSDIEARRIVRRVAGFALLLVLGARAVAAEGAAEATPPPPGSRVRILSSAESEPFIGTLAAMEVDALVLKRAGSDTTSRIPIAEILKLETSAGRRSHAARGALIGGAVGAVPGLLMSVGDYSSEVHGDSNAGTVAVVGAAGGALVGAAIGWAIKTEQWVPSELPKAAVALVPLRGGVALSFRMTWGNGAR